MDREAWRTAIHAVAKGWTWLSDGTTIEQAPPQICASRHQKEKPRRNRRKPAGASDTWAAASPGAAAVASGGTSSSSSSTSTASRWKPELPMNHHAVWCNWVTEWPDIWSDFILGVSGWEQVILCTSPGRASSNQQRAVSGHPLGSCPLSPCSSCWPTCVFQTGRDVVCTESTARLRVGKATPERVKGRKTRGLQAEEAGCKCQAFFLSLLRVGGNKQV